MAQYFAYTGWGGLAAPSYSTNGTQLPTLPNSAGTVKAGEVTIAQVMAPDIRQGAQAGVLLTGLVNFVNPGTWGIGTIMARQIINSGNGTNTATTGSILGTYFFGAATTPASQAVPLSVAFIDNSGTFPLTGWNLTMALASGTATINQAVFTAQALGG